MGFEEFFNEIRKGMSEEDKIKLEKGGFLLELFYLKGKKDAKNN